MSYNNLPQTVDGQTLRQLSKTKSRSYNLVSDVDFDDQQLCHKVPNELLVLAYNSTNDMKIKEEIVKFNYSNLNIFRSTHNKDHSEMERRLKNGTATNEDIRHKGGSIENALEKMQINSDEFSAKTLALIIKTMRNCSDSYQKLVSGFDQRTFNSDKVKREINAARNNNTYVYSKSTSNLSQSNFRPSSSSSSYSSPSFYSSSSYSSPSPRSYNGYNSSRDPEMELVNLLFTQLALGPSYHSPYQSSYRSNYPPLYMPSYSSYPSSYSPSYSPSYSESFNSPSSSSGNPSGNTTSQRAPSGGAVSPVNGQFYKGGQFMPVFKD